MTLKIPEFRFCPRCGSTVWVIFSEGRQRPVCTSCGHIIYVNPFPAATLVLERDGLVLLTLRAAEPHKGKWCLPGGFLEWGESPEEGAARELEEETGFKATKLSLMGVYDSISSEYSHVVLITFRVDEFTGEPSAGDDAEDMEWFDLNSVPSLAFKSHNMIIEDYRKKIINENTGG